MGEEPDHTAVDYFQGLNRFWQPGLPTALPAASEADLENDPLIRELNRKIQEAVDDDSKNAAKRDRKNTLKRMRSSALKMHREEIMRERRQIRLERGIDASTPEGDPDPLNELIPERGRIAQAIASDQPISPEIELSLMRDAQYLLTTSWTVFYRPGETPQGTSCSFCQKDIEW